jgi:hypothetical protein
MAMQQHNKDKCTRMKVRELISDLENDLHRYERLGN